MSFALMIQQSWEKTHLSLFSWKLNHMCQLTSIVLLLGIPVTLYLEHNSEWLGVEASVELYCLSSAWQSTWGGPNLFTFQVADSTVHIKQIK